MRFTNDRLARRKQGWSQRELVLDIRVRFCVAIAAPIPLSAGHYRIHTLELPTREWTITQQTAYLNFILYFFCQAYCAFAYAL